MSEMNIKYTLKRIKHKQNVNKTHINTNRLYEKSVVIHLQHLVNLENIIKYKLQQMAFTFISDVCYFRIE